MTAMTVPAAVLRQKSQKNTKPARTMTHPLHEPKPPKARSQKAEPLDPDELTRRLTAYMLDQEARAQRRRAARMAKEQAEARNGVYHHVPLVAASAFHRTTTPDVRPKVHKLAVGDELAQHPVPTLQQRMALDRAMIEKERLRHRNQFQWVNGMEDAAEVDEKRDVFKAPTRTFAEFTHLRGQRPLSMGDAMFLEHEDGAMEGGKVKAKLVFDGRNDWAQVENKEGTKRSSLVEKGGSFLKKKESIWVLKGKKEKEKEKGVKAREEKDEAVAGIGGLDSPPLPASKGRKNSFLARFALKRQPS